MKIHWWAAIVGYLLGSFFGLSRILSLFGGLGGSKAQPQPASS